MNYVELSDRLTRCHLKQSQYENQIINLQSQIEKMNNEKMSALSPSPPLTSHRRFKSLNEIEIEKFNFPTIENYLSSRESNNFDLRNKNDKLTINNDDLFKYNNDLSVNNRKLPNELEKINNGYNKVNEKYNDLYSKYLSKEKYNKEKQMTKLANDKENLYNKIKQYEINSINDNKEMLYKKISEISDENIAIKNNYSNLIKECNQNIEIIIDWIQKYMNGSSICHNSNIVPEINININNGVDFSKIKLTLMKIKNIYDAKFSEFNQMIDKLKKNNENSHNIIEILQRKIDNIYHKLLHEIKNENHFNKNIINNNDIKNEINKYIMLFKEITISSNEKIQKLLEDNTMLTKENNNFRNKTIALFNENKILKDKNIELLENNDKLFEIMKNGENISKNKNLIESNNAKLLNDNIILIKQIKELKSQLQAICQGNNINYTTEDSI